MKGPLLEVRDLGLLLGGQQVLEAVSFALKAGEYVSIVGANGAGKSSLLRVILSVLPQSCGEVRVKGLLSGDLSRKEFARLIAYVPQNGQGVFPHSAFDFVMLGRFAHSGFFGASSKRDREVVRHALQLTGTESFAERPLSDLSGGERQRVVIASALAQEPELLLLDEVCHFLDPRHQSEILDLLRQINREEGVAVLSVTHDINEAALHSRRIMALKAGRVVYDGEAGEFVQNDLLRLVFERDFSVFTHPDGKTKLVLPDTGGSLV